MKCKYALTDSTDPYHNLAIEQNLMKYVSAGEYILFLWQNDNTIVVGRNQDVYMECRLDLFLEKGGRVARRRSGGGAVFHDLGNINYSIITTKNEAEKVNYQSFVRNALNGMGIEVLYNGRNDFTYHGKKFSGNAAYTENNRTCQHGTIMVSTNIEKMNFFLTPENSKLVRNRISSVEERVINLSDISSEITVDSVKEALIKTTDGIQLGYEQNDDALDSYEKFYKSSEWIYGGIR